MDEKIVNNDENIEKEESLFEELPILISIDDNGKETYLIQTHDYKFAQFLAMLQNRSRLDIIHSLLEQGLSEEATHETVDNLINFCQLLYFWADKAYTIDDEMIKILKGDKENESDSDSK